MNNDGAANHFLSYETPTLLREIWLLSSLAANSIILQLGAMLSPALAASVIGREFGKVALDGFSLASIVCNITGYSIMQGIISASDTLSPQAFGSGNMREVGLIAIRSMFTSILLLPIQAITMICMKPALLWWGEDAESTNMALHWYSIYIFSLPCCVAYLVIMRFLVAQEIIFPLVVVTIISTGVILPLGLKICVTLIGFYGSAVGLVIYQIVQVVLLLLYLSIFKPHMKGTWPGFRAWKEALRYEPFVQFFKLALGGILSMSEWWFWEVICLIAGSFGVVPLSVQTIVTQVLQVFLMIPSGVSFALTMRIGLTLPNNVRRAKCVALGCIIGSSFMMGILCIVLYALRFQIHSLFTNDKAVIEGCDEIWKHFCLFILLCSVYFFIVGLMCGLRMQLTCGKVSLFSLWFIALPTVLHISVVRGGGLVSLWSVLSPAYAFVDVILCYLCITADWDKISMNILHEAELGDEECDVNFRAENGLNRTRYSEYQSIRDDNIFQSKLYHIPKTSSLDEDGSSSQT